MLPLSLLVEIRAPDMVFALSGQDAKVSLVHSPCAMPLTFALT
jgi:hypothetical protein